VPCLVLPQSGNDLLARQTRLKQCPPEDRFRSMGYRSRSGCLHYIIA
jgi:hypothetical protein